MTDRSMGLLERARRQLGLSHHELWWRYFELGGMSSEFELEAVLLGKREPEVHEHDLIAHALNERFVELGGNHPVPYWSGETSGESASQAGS